VRDVLPIDPFIPQLVTELGRSRALVVTARPGAGKTTRIPPALLDVGPPYSAAAAVAARHRPQGLRTSAVGTIGAKSDGRSG
jgi:ATP-dependent helicase HrpB